MNIQLLCVCTRNTVVLRTNVLVNVLFHSRHHFASPSSSSSSNGNDIYSFAIWDCILLFVFTMLAKLNQNNRYRERFFKPTSMCVRLFVFTVCLYTQQCKYPTKNVTYKLICQCATCAQCTQIYFHLQKRTHIHEKYTCERLTKLQIKSIKCDYWCDGLCAIYLSRGYSHEQFDAGQQ